MNWTIFSAAVLLSSSVGILIRALVLAHRSSQAIESERNKVAKEWLAVADKYEELAKYAEDLSHCATEIEARRLQAVSKGYAEIYSGNSKADPNKVN